MRHLRSLGAFLTLALAACVPGGGEPTWHRDVGPIVAVHCTSCHTEKGSGGFSLETYDAAKPLAGLIGLAVADRRMPPWPPESDLPFRHDRRLSAEQVATIAAWVEAGAPEGDPSTAPKDPPRRDLPSITVSLEVPMKAPYRPDLRVTDDYRCFVLEPGLDRNRIVSGFDIRPGNTAIVHHVILYAVPPSRHGRLAQLEARDEGEGYTCYGDSGVSDASMIGGWVPGTTATVFPLGTGVPVEAGSKLVMQVHYNTLTTKDAEDLTVAELELVPLDDAPFTSDAYIFPFLNRDFLVPPGEVKTVSATYDTGDFDLPDDLVVRLHGVLPHMHVHGRAIRVTVEKKDGRVVELVHVPRWDFEWQQFYFYEEPITLVRGDKFTLECTFDNRAEAQPIINGQRVEPVPLVWGEDTLQEMCLTFGYLTVGTAR